MVSCRSGVLLYWPGWIHVTLLDLVGTSTACRDIAKTAFVDFFEKNTKELRASQNGYGYFLLDHKNSKDDNDNNENYDNNYDENYY